MFVASSSYGHLDAIELEALLPQVEDEAESLDPREAAECAEY